MAASDKKKILVITTVGESLLTRRRDDLLRKMLEEANNGLTEEQRNNLYDAFVAAQPKVNDEKITKALNGYTPSLNAQAAPCAELTSLKLLLEELKKQFNANFECDHVLVATKETKQWADLLKGWLEKHKSQMFVSNSDIQVCEAGELDVVERDKFRAGLAQVTGSVIQESRKEGYAARYLNLTGGYKGIIPVLSLLGYTESVSVCYAHEKSSDILIMPELPVAWDRQRLDEVRGYVLREKISTDEYRLVPEEFKFLFQLPQGARECERSAVGKLVACADTLSTRFGYGRYLLDMLDPEDRQKLEGSNGKLREWEHLWLGDQIPETVEHSRLHSLRLLGFAYQLFLAFPDLLNEVGGPHGLYLLICAIWLHDIGHSALEFEHNGQRLPIALMPSLVREWHHYSSAAKIRADKQCMDDEADRKIVALIAEYHRGRMKLDSSQDQFDEPYGHAILTGKRDTLMKKLNNGLTLPNGLKPVHVLTLAALLRFLDGCDVQADRTGGDKYINARGKRTDDEVKFLEGRLSNLAVSYRECHYLAFCDAVSKKDHVKLLHVSLNDQIEFKKKQFEHFKEHQSIKLVYLYKDCEGKLRVGLEPTEKAKTDPEYAGLLKKRAKGIAKEYDDVKEQLEALPFGGVFVIDDEKEIPADNWKNYGGKT
jgi:putative CRISPR-associated protein (TIGR02619 family)